MTGMEIPLLASAASTASAATATTAAAGTAATAASSAGFFSSLGSIASIVSFGSGLYSAYNQYQAGNVEQKSYNLEAGQLAVQADFEKTRAIQEEANRQARLNEILGLQMAGQAGRGTVMGSGTDIAISDFSEQEAQRESDIANLDSKFQQSQIKSRAIQSRMSGKASLLNSRYTAAGTLIDTGIKAYERRLT